MKYPNSTFLRRLPLVFSFITGFMFIWTMPLKHFEVLSDHLNWLLLESDIKYSAEAFNKSSKELHNQYRQDVLSLLDTLQNEDDPGWTKFKTRCSDYQKLSKDL